MLKYDAENDPIIIIAKAKLRNISPNTQDQKLIELHGFYSSKIHASAKAKEATENDD